MNEKDFGKIFDRLVEPIFRFIYFRVFDRESAKDLTQEVFYKVWKVLNEGMKIHNLRAFIYLTARNLVIDEKRKKRALPLSEVLETEQEPKVFEQEKIWQKIEDENLRLLLQSLEDEEKEVLEMRYLRQLKVKEMAEILRITPNAVSLRLGKAKKKLKEKMI